MRNKKLEFCGMTIVHCKPPMTIKLENKEGEYSGMDVVHATDAITSVNMTATQCCLT